MYVQRLMAMAFVSSEHAVLRLARPCRRKQQRRFELKLFYIFAFEWGLEHIYQMPPTLPLFNCDDPAVRAEVGFRSSAADPRGDIIGPKEFAFLQ